MTAATSSVRTMGFANCAKKRLRALGFGGGGSSFLPSLASRAAASPADRPCAGSAVRRASRASIGSACHRDALLMVTSCLRRCAPSDAATSEALATSEGYHGFVAMRSSSEARRRKDLPKLCARAGPPSPVPWVAERDLLEAHPIEIACVADVQMPEDHDLGPKPRVPIMRAPRAAPDAEPRHEGQARVLAFVAGSD